MGASSDTPKAPVYSSREVCTSLKRVVQFFVDGLLSLLNLRYA
jgi:hypothetical protein